MNTINVKVNFTKGTCEVSGINLISGDYNSTKMVFTFDRDDGTKIFEMKSPSEELVMLQEIQNNEIILYGLDDNEQIASIFTEDGNYIFEISLYKNGSKLTSASGKLKVKPEQVVIDGEVVEAYLPVFDQLMAEINEAITETNNLNLDMDNTLGVVTATITKKDGTTKEVEVIDTADYYTKTEVDSIKTTIEGEIPTKVSQLTNDSAYINKEVNNLTNYTLGSATASTADLTMDSSYVITLTLKNNAGTTLVTKSVDLPLETMVVDGYYDSVNKKLVLELDNGTEIKIPVGDLISGLQTEITNSNKLSSDLVDDTGHINKFVTASDKTTWSAKYDKPSGGIPETDLSSAVQTSLGKADSALQSHQDISGKEDKSNKVTSISGSSTDTQYPSAKCVYDSQQVQNATIDEVIAENDYLNSIIDQIVPKVTGSGEYITLNDTIEAKMDIDLYTKLLSQKTNLFNNDIEQGAISEGSDVSSTNRIRTKGYIEVLPSTSLLINFSGCDEWFVSFYNSSKTYVSAVGWQPKGNSVSIPSNIYYIRVAFRKSDNSNITPSSISDVQIGNIPNPSYPQDIHTISGSNKVVVCGKQLFDKNSPNIQNGYLNANGTISSNNSYRVSDYIYIGNFAKITLSGNNENGLVYCFYTQDKSLNGANAISGTSKTITPPAGTKFIRVTIKADNLDNYMIESGETATTYEPYIGEEANIDLGDIEYCKIGNYEDKFMKPSGANLMRLGTQSNGYRSIDTGLFQYHGSAIGYYFKTSQLPNTITFTGIGSNRSNVSYYNDIPVNGATSLDYSNSSTTPRTITVNKNYTYIHIQFSYGGDVTDIMVNEGSTALPYEPYGTGWYLKKNIGKVDLGTLSYSKVTNATYGDYFKTSDITNAVKQQTYYLTSFNALCNSYRVAGRNVSEFLDNTFVFDGTSTAVTEIQFKNSNYSDATTFKNSLSGVYLYYPILTQYLPITGTLANQLDNIKSKLLSQKGQTNISQVNNDLPFEISVSALGELNV